MGGGNPSDRLRLAEQLLGLFKGREKFIAVGTNTGFRPEPLTAPLTADRLAAVSAISSADLKRTAASINIALQQAPQPVAVAQHVTISAAGLSPHVRGLLAEDGVQALRGPISRCSACWI
jgi:hypothetical protein